MNSKLTDSDLIEPFLSAAVQEWSPRRVRKRIGKVFPWFWDRRDPAAPAIRVYRAFAGECKYQRSARQRSAMTSITANPVAA
jgi:hypothetical protein